jgi:hypothetical protein
LEFFLASSRLAGVFPAVVVDLGSQLSPSETAWVLDACNAAIVKGTCELDAAPGGEPPRAIAIVRLIGERGRSVRLEVGLREEERASWSVREIEFSHLDPPRERWRSVGLVLATLVGEVEAREAERNTADAPAVEPAPERKPESRASPSAVESPRGESAAASDTAATDTAATDTAATDTAVAPRQSGAVPNDAGVTSPRARAEALPHVPLPRPSIFIGVGVLAGPGPDVSPMSWGGGVRGAWISSTGWMLSLSGDVSVIRFEESEVAVRWVRAAAGTGYRVWLSERWSLGLGLEFGVRGLQVAPESAGSIRNSTWSPRAAADVEAWWQAVAVGGVWAGVTVSSIGRETRLLGRDREPDVVLPATELHAMLGLWWAL